MEGRGPQLGPAAAAQLLLDAEAAGLAAAEVVVVQGPPAGERLVLLSDGRHHGSLGDPVLDRDALELARDLIRSGDSRTERVGDALIFVRVQRPAESLVIVGAGHIAIPLAELGARLGFAVSVLDDREEFATADRFPDAVHVVRANFGTDPFAGVHIDERTSIALVTRGHRWDFDCLQRLLALPFRPRYLGMIGSRRRVRAAFTALLAAGTPRDELARIHAPIGIEIGAETPEEIAVSIAAELIAARRGARVETMTTRERVLDRLLPEPTESNG